MDLPDTTISVELHERLSDMGERVLQPELIATGDSVPISSVPSIARPQDFSFSQFLTNVGVDAATSVVVFDDLDELHPELSHIFLRCLEAHIAETSGQSPLKYIIFGRPEAFSGWLRNDRRMPPAQVHPPFELILPKYSTTGDVKFRFVEWATHVKRRSEPTHDEFARLLELLRAHGYLTYTLGSLAVGNYVLEQALRSQPLSSFDLRESLFNNLLERNHETHFRPKDTRGAYVRALEVVAAEYSQKVDQLIHHLRWRVTRRHRCSACGHSQAGHDY
jgi:hypothetical protein